MSKPALGRGLSALLGGKPSGAVAPAKAPGPGTPAGNNPPASTASDAATTPSTSPAEPSAGRVERVDVTRIRPSALQPRRVFPSESLQELADSIREQGILQPLIVRRQGDAFELIAGERRWRAAQLAGLTEVPVVLREADDTTALELMLVENLQREDLNPIDEAQGYAELMERFRLTQDLVATKVGRSRTSVTNSLRLLRLPDEVRGLLREGKISTGHAKVILTLTESESQSSAARAIVASGMSVRQSEELVSRLATPAPVATGTTPPTAKSAAVALRDPHVAAIEDKLRQRLGTRVTLRYRQGRGQLDIRFFSDAELERVLEIVGVRPE